MRVIAGAAALTLFSAALPAAAQSLLSVDRTVWTDSVDRDSRTFGLIYTSPITTNRICLWMQVRGTSELLGRLQSDSQGRVGIKHNWYCYDSDSLYSDASVKLEIGGKSDLRKLQYQLESEGTFTWRVCGPIPLKTSRSGK